MENILELARFFIACSRPYLKADTMYGDGLNDIVFDALTLVKHCIRVVAFFIVFRRMGDSN